MPSTQVSSLTHESLRDADKSKPFIPLANGPNDGWSSEDEATATCFCGAIQLKFPTKAPGLVVSFLCNCYDCHKFTAAMFAANFTALDSHITHLRGADNFSTYSTTKTIGTDNTMTNYFCKTCGTLMYRKGTGFPGMSICRLGTVDDLNLLETKLKPTVETFAKDRVCWLAGGEGVTQEDAWPYGPPKGSKA